jgi:hypothetical protein
VPKGDFARWVGVSDEQQAQYMVRSFLVLWAMDVDRAYSRFATRSISTLIEKQERSDSSPLL